MNTWTERRKQVEQLAAPVVLVLGGYGTFGSRISRALCKKGFHVIINGRHFHQAQALKHSILEEDFAAQVTVSCFDVYSQLNLRLKKMNPQLVIHTCGPFQGQDTYIAQTTIKAGIHYLDLSDDRGYVQKMLALNDLAQANGVMAITGASTVPALSSAVLAYVQDKYAIDRFKAVKIGISPGQKTARGLATTQAVLSYIGKALKPWPGNQKKRYGWQDTYLQEYPSINSRLMGNCESPDLDCLHHHFNIEQLSFSAGMESKLLHRLIWVGSWLIRLGLPLKLKNHAKWLLKSSRWFDSLGTEDGGMHVEFEVKLGKGQKTISKTWFIEATGNQGPQIPAIPAILMAEKILKQPMSSGVQVCVNLIQLEEYLKELEQFDSKHFHSCIQ
ncbi:hypothetical protein MNBD_GAMMA02-1123 [hydrothermal vent metagenome]|uniref:Saccharopine dehydrogenase NADP binding domain-containing protein n=1 Tax=hydrothermal vent metagenome TaxID=652676 RepID=A0A3B0VML9_9ZZZZ